MGDIISTVLTDAAAVAANPILGLVKVAADVAPTIWEWITGDDSDDTAKKVAEVVKAVTGTDNPTDAAAAISDPNLRFQLQAKLAEYAAQAKAAEHEEIMARQQQAHEEVVAKINEIAQARAAFGGNSEIFSMARWLLLSFGILSALCIVGSFLVLGGVVKVDAQNIGMVAAVFGFLGTIFGSVAGAAMNVVTFFFGSSQQAGDSQAAVTRAIADIGSALKNSAPALKKPVR